MAVCLASLSGCSMLSPLRINLAGKGLDLQIDAGNLGAAILLVAACTQAEFGKADVPTLAQLQAGGDQHAVNLNAGLALEFKQDGHRTGIVGATAENPAATAKNGSGEGLDQSRGLFDRNSVDLHRPGGTNRRCCIASWHR